MKDTLVTYYHIIAKKNKIITSNKSSNLKIESFYIIISILLSL